MSKIEFSATISPSSLNFTSRAGKNLIVASTHANNLAIREVLKQLLKAKKEKDTGLVATLWEEAEKLTDVAETIAAKSGGKVTVKNGNVYYNDEIVHGTLVDRILWGLREGYPVESSLRLLENIMDNPSARAVKELYGFLEACSMGTTDDGYIIAYKKVREDYKDIYSGTYDNSPGQVLEMRRNLVDDDKNRTCSSGFHFCSQSYLPHFGAGTGNRIVIVKINPRDVVSIPTDYNNAKARCCKYEVIGEYTAADKNDILSGKAVWTEKDIQRNFTPDYDFEDREFGNEEDNVDNSEYDTQIDDECYCRLCGTNLEADYGDNMAAFVCAECIQYDPRAAKYTTPDLGSPTLQPVVPPVAPVGNNVAYDIPEEISDEYQFHAIPRGSTSEIDSVAVTKTKDGAVRSNFKFEDGLSEYNIVVDIGPDGKAVAKVEETAKAPNKPE